MFFSRRDVLKTGAALSLSTGLSSLTSRMGNAAEPYEDAVLMAGEPPLPQPGSFTIAVLPDTQNYSEKFPQNFTAQTQWLVEQQKARNIQCVLHLGDITNHNSPPEWENAVNALSVLDGKLPYFFVPGNHDYSEGGSCRDRTTLLNDYFPIAKFRELPTFGGVYDREPQQMENSFHLFETSGRKFLVLGLEFGPRKDVVRWANEVAGDHRDREIILITHAYIYYDDTRYNWAKYGPEQKWNPHSYPVAQATGDDVNDGEELWNNLVSRHKNFILTLNGHVLGDGLGRVRTTAAGREIEQLLVNFQMRPNGGDGWLRLLEFPADGRTVQVYDYSPVLNQRNESGQNRFAFEVPSPNLGA